MSRNHSAPTHNRAFFESHPRAALLRGTGLAGAEAFLSVGQGNEEAVGPLLDANQRLRQLGIVAGMHEIKGDGWLADFRRRRLATSPVRVAEYACSQLVNVLNGTVSLAPPDPVVLREHDILSSENGELGNAAIADGSSIPPALLDYQVYMSVAEHVVGMLDGQSDSN